MVKNIRKLKRSKRPFLLLMSDKKLVEAFMKNEPNSFSKIYRRFNKPVLRTISKRIYNASVAEELLQEVFLRVYRFREQYNPEFEFSTWLWTVAKNVTSDYLSRSQSDPLLIRSYTEFHGDIQELSSPQRTAEALCIKKAERRDLFKMLMRLPRLQRKAILLRVMRGRSYDEIAVVLKLSLSAVKSLIHRGKASLQTVMVQQL